MRAPWVHVDEEVRSNMGAPKAMLVVWNVAMVLPADTALAVMLFTSNVSWLLPTLQLEFVDPSQTVFHAVYGELN